MLAWIDNRIPTLVNERSWFLLVAFSVLAFFISRLSPLPRETQDRLALFYPPAIFAYWFLFQFQLISLEPGVHYYLGRSSRFSWMMNSGICYAFGAAFSFRLLRSRRLLSRIEGGFFLALFGLLILLGEQMRPAMMST